MKTSLLVITFFLTATLASRAADAPEKSEIESLTETSLVSFGRAVKKKDFSAFYDEIAEVWKKQTSAEKLNELFKGFLDKGIDIPSIVKDAILLGATDAKCATHAQGGAAHRCHFITAMVLMTGVCAVITYAMTTQGK